MTVEEKKLTYEFVRNQKILFLAIIPNDIFIISPLWRIPIKIGKITV
jgi:hypothetical protein